MIGGWHVTTRRASAAELHGRVPTGEVRSAEWYEVTAPALVLGEVWCQALAAVDVADATVHRGALVHTEWSRLVCFDGLGSGEVVVGDRKVVGISQRRTRSWLRLQSSVHLAWRPELLVSLLAPPAPTAAELRAPVCADVPPAVLRAAVEAALATR